MSNRDILVSYIPMVNFIADVCGSNYEILLHDISTPEESVIAIRNGHHSGRKIGSPLTDLARQIVANKSYLDNDYITNYTGTARGKEFLSSTYFIKTKGELIGLICINNDVAPIVNLQASLSSMLKSFTAKNDNSYSENIDHNPVMTLANSIISETISNYNVPPERMSIEEKVSIVQNLNDKGVLLLKGAIAEVAEELKVSEGTIYRYLSKK